MHHANLSEAGTARFKLLLRTDQSQVAVMTLQPGQSSSSQPNRHEHSDQVLVLLSGQLQAEVKDERRTLRPNDVVIVPANAPHRFTNDGSGPAVTFNVYAPPAYDQD